MKLYRPRPRFTGGHIGKVYHGVIKTARRIANSKVGKELAQATKKKILEVGSDAVKSIIAGKDPGESIKTAGTALAQQLPPIVKQKFKRSVLKSSKKTRKLKKLGGAGRGKDNILYKLPKKRPTTRYRVNPKAKKGNTVRYRINPAKRSGKKKNAKKKKAPPKRRSRRKRRVVKKQRQRKQKSRKKPKKKTKKKKKRKTKKPRGKRTKRRTTPRQKRPVKARRLTRRAPKRVRTVFDL